ncbi:MAG: DUF4384 domain-containing protein [Cytophagaceae bacterium]|nr:DUF4384 domain-containing protein [Cytophagaceae bacterium]
MKQILIITLMMLPFFAFCQGSRGFITKEAGRQKVEAEQKIIKEGVLATSGSLKLKIKTNKGEGSVAYKEGETMTISFLVNEPCYLRLIYRLADGKLILLRDDLFVSNQEISKWVQLPDEFECSAPFGYENLITFASSTPFEKLQTEEENGYMVITSALENVLNSTRGMKKATNTKSQKVEDQILVITKKN